MEYVTPAGSSKSEVQALFDDETLIRVAVPKPLLSDPEHGYISEYILPPEGLDEADVALIGFPIDIGASYRMIPGIRPSGGSPAEGQMGIRRALGFCRTYSFSLGLDMRTETRIADMGNVFIANTDRYEDAFGKLERVMRAVLAAGVTPIVLGGDNSTSYATFKTFAEHHGDRVGLIWLDAHTDTSDHYRGDRFWCGSPMARILEMPTDLVDPKNLVMLGIRGFDHSAAMIKVARDAGAPMYHAELVHERGVVSVAEEVLRRVQDGTKAFYVMWDPDVMEAAFVPGHAVATTGGLLPYQIRQLIRLFGLSGAGGLDVVEVAPGLDVRDVTVRLASETVLDFISAIAKRRVEGIETVADAVSVMRSCLQPS